MERPLSVPTLERPADAKRPSASAARTVDAVKLYGKDQTEVRALDSVSVSFDSGCFTIISCIVASVVWAPPWQPEHPAASPSKTSLPCTASSRSAGVTARRNPPR